MNNAIKMILSFTAGAGIGSCIAYALTKKRYMAICDEAIADIKAHYTYKKPENGPESDETEENEEKVEEYKNYAEIDVQRESEWVQNVKTVLEKEKKLDEECEKNPEAFNPYILDPDDFGLHDMKVVTMTYYVGDDCLIEDYDYTAREMSDIEIKNTIGTEWKNVLMTGESDEVHVRNPRLKTDYEIIRDDMAYSDIQYLEYEANE